MRTTAPRKAAEVLVTQADGTAASIGSSVGFWPEVRLATAFGFTGFTPDVWLCCSVAYGLLAGKLGVCMRGQVNDFVTTVDARFGRPGFPRSWPQVYTSSKALRRLLGKKGLQGAMSKTVDLLSKVH